MMHVGLIQVERHAWRRIYSIGCGQRLQHASALHEIPITWRLEEVACLVSNDAVAYIDPTNPFRVHLGGHIDSIRTPSDSTEPPAVATYILQQITVEAGY